MIAATSSIQREIRRWYKVESEIICEVAAPPPTTPTHSLRADRDPLRIAWSGRHFPGKTLHLLLRALSRLPASTDWRLDIYGDGPSRPGWYQLANRLGIGSRCIWHGQVPRGKALDGLKAAHLFVTTSLKDLTSTVIIEALTNGVPVACPDHCGFTDVVNESCGITIPIRDVREFEVGMTSAICTLAQHESLRRQLAAGALHRARDLSWEAKTRAIDRIYDRVVSPACGTMLRYP